MVADRSTDPVDDRFGDGLLGLVVVAIGTDLVDIDRMRTAIDRSPTFAERVFTEDERAYCRKRRDPAERYAVRFAAKEAVLKAIGTGLGGADFHDIEVVRQSSGKPELRLRGRAADKAAEIGIRSWLITLSHSDHLAQAFVAGLGTPPPTPSVSQSQSQSQSQSGRHQPGPVER